MSQRLASLLVAAALAAGSAGCGDPLIVTGDAPGFMRVVAGVPERPGTNVDSTGTGTKLYNPAGLAVAEDGDLYVADSGNGRVLEVASTGAVRVIAGAPGCMGPCPVSPRGLALDGAGGLLIADPGAHRVFRVLIASRFLSVVAGNGEQGDAPDGAMATDAPLDRPAGVAVDEDGRIYFSEQGGHRVRLIAADGTLGTVAGTGVAGFDGDGGPASAAQLDEPVGLAIDRDRLFVADRLNVRIRVIDLTEGTISTVVGDGRMGFDAADSVATQAALDRPEAVAVSEDGGTLFIADTYNHRVRRVDLEADRITTFAGTGGLEFTGDLRDAGESALRYPAGVATAPREHLFIADTGHQIVWRSRYGF